MPPTEFALFGKIAFSVVSRRTGLAQQSRAQAEALHDQAGVGDAAPDLESLLDRGKAALGLAGAEQGPA